MTGTSHPWGDVHLRLFPRPSEKTTIGEAIAKITYSIDPAGQRLRPAPPRPLVNDVRNEKLDPPIPAHSDFWPGKDRTDVAVLGSGHVRDGRPATDLLVGVFAGGRRRALRVHGPRAINFRSDGRPEIGPADPFERMELGIQHAYGGLDLRVPFDRDDRELAMLVALRADAPGLYPRNPWGRGYLCVPEPVEGCMMPTQEDASDPLTADRLIADPERWWRQPMPGYLDWTPINCFPRSLFLDADASPWFAPPQDSSLAEVANGVLPEDYRDLLEDLGDEAAAHGEPAGPHPRFFREASPGLSLPLEQMRSHPLGVVNMHPDHPVLTFPMPEPPEFRLAFEKDRACTAPAVTSVEILPEELLVSVTYTASMPAPRLFMPGIHSKIPFGVAIGDQEPVWFEAPEPLKAQIARGQQDDPGKTLPFRDPDDPDATVPFRDGTGPAPDGLP